MPDLLSQLEREPWYRGQVIQVEEVPPRPGVYADPPPALPSSARAWLEDQGIRLFAHQAQAMAHLLAGRDVVLATGPSSGKTLAMALPVVAALAQDPTATALLLCPMKALAQDQLEKWAALARALGVAGAVGVYDGDTPVHRRPRLRSEGRILLTNPYALHQYLEWHHRWAPFLRGVRFVVVDEGHWYRGVFGSGVALLLRRLERVLGRYGTTWTYALASATAGDPRLLGERLLGRPVAVVDADGSPHGRRTWWFWDPDRDPQLSPFQQAVRLAVFLAREGRQTLAFLPSRRMAEALAQAAREAWPGQAVAAYRAGYRPEERRALEGGLRDGTLRLVASTCALELGVDVGGLDAVVLVGYPGSVASARQESGRAGRGGRDALVVYMPQDDPLDRYFLHRPRELVDGVAEAPVLNPGHRELAVRHLLCAAAELPVRREDLPRLGATAEDVAALEQAGLLAATPSGWSYAGRVRPAEAVSLNALTARQVQLVVNGKVLETWDELRARREAFPGAVVAHQGELFRVRALDLDRGVAEAEPSPDELTTKALAVEEARILTPLALARDVAFGRIHVRETIPAYKVLDRGRMVDMRPLDLPPVEFESEGVWLTWERDVVPTASFFGGLHGAEHALVALVPLLARCEPGDVGGVASPLHPDTGRPTVLVYDAFPGGIGIASILYARAQEWIGRTAAHLTACPCRDGCPRCVLSPRCGTGNQPMDKAAALHLLGHWLRKGHGTLG
ncbi:DEAD/DEAH box helicase [Candidatus Bipolaricaulota bacterium]|nr:DEAD/DEAH box helicase [Candidatus Bipolaricaulota bacterium]